MQRRDTFRLVFQSGLVAAATRVVRDEPAEASNVDAAPSVEFQEGTLRGGKFEGWEALLAITGRAVRGTIYDPNSVTASGFTGFRVRGTARGATLVLDFYDLDDLAFAKPVGGGKGKEKGRKTTTRFEVSGSTLMGAQSGSMATREVGTSRRSSRELAGSYWVEVRDPNTGDLTASLHLSAESNGKFTLDDLSSSSLAGKAQTIAGRYAASRGGDVYYTLLLPKISLMGLDFDPSEVNVLRPLEPDLALTGEEWALAIVNCLCNHHVTVELTVEVRREVTANQFEPAAGVPVRIKENGLTHHTDDQGMAYFSLAENAFVTVVVEGMEQTASLGLSGAGLNFDILLNPGPSLSGRVTDFDTGNPIDRVLVELLLKGSRVRATETNDAGDYSLLAVTAGTYEIRVTKAGYDLAFDFMIINDPVELDFQLHREA